MEKRVPSEDILSVFVMCSKNKSAMKGIHSLPVIKLYRIHRGQELVFFLRVSHIQVWAIVDWGALTFQAHFITATQWNKGKSYHSNMFLTKTMILMQTMN